MLEGTCFCGAVSFRAASDPVGVISCHCTDCQKMHGTYNAMAAVPRDTLTIEGPVRWYDSSESAKRGFCETCGARLFKDNNGSDKVMVSMVSMGAIDTPTGLRKFKNLFVESKGDWYELPAEEAPRFKTG